MEKPMVPPCGLDVVETHVTMETQKNTKNKGLTGIAMVL
jgi:hypothetical protein